MNILSGCVGWQLEAVRRAEGNATELCLRLGPIFRLRLTLPSPGSAQEVAHARLELTTPGTLSCHLSYTMLALRVSDVAFLSIHMCGRIQVPCIPAGLYPFLVSISMKAGMQQEDWLSVCTFYGQVLSIVWGFLTCVQKGSFSAAFPLMYHGSCFLLHCELIATACLNDHSRRWSPCTSLQNCRCMRQTRNGESVRMRRGGTQHGAESAPGGGCPLPSSLPGCGRCWSRPQKRAGRLQHHRRQRPPAGRPAAPAPHSGAV